LTHSIVVKLKIFLLIDLIIVGATVGTYFYFQHQGLIPERDSIMPAYKSTNNKSAVFVFTDLLVNPSETFAGQPIQISVNVTNIGDIGGHKTVELEINGVVKDSVDITLTGLNASKIVEFTVFEIDEGDYTVKIDDLVSSFVLKKIVDGDSGSSVVVGDSSSVILYGLKISPAEIRPGESTTISATAINPSENADTLRVTLTVDNVSVETKIVNINAHATVTADFTISASVEGTHTVKLNGLNSSFTVVPAGYYTLVIDRSGGEGVPLPFTLNGAEHETVFSALLPAGQYKVTVPTILNIGTGVVEFGSWSDGSRSPSLTFTLDKPLTLVANYNLISGYASCPSLYIWNGNDYTYITDVSNSGWLGYIGYINANGDIIFSGGNPYDYVKLDKDVLTAKNGYFDIALSQQWDELFYLDTTSLLVVDHPVGTDVYTSMTNYLNKGYTGQIYTTTTSTLLSPINAINEKGQDVLAAILVQDGNFTPGVNGNDSPSWDNIVQNQLTLNLGDLSKADTIKLVITGMVDWGPADTYYNWINQFKEAASSSLIADGTPITPMSKMEILLNDDKWIEAPQDRQIPLPSDYTARTFTVDLTGLFPKDTTNYVIRFTNFWNVTYDYIGIDTTSQQDITITTLKPSSAKLGQFWDTTSTSSGAFTRYGDVTELLQEIDDIFIIGRQGDQINIQFYIENLPEPVEGMERDYFFVVACWFKDPPGEWGYGYTFTVEPLPFLNMTGFPYTNKEIYPYDITHISYINEYNTRIIT